MQESDETPPFTVDRSLSVENFLLQELQIRSNAMTQIRSDNTGIFNIYLVLIGLMLTGVAALQTLKFQIIDAGRAGFTSLFNVVLYNTVVPLKTVLLIEINTIIVFVAWGVLSYIFLRRFLRQTRRESENNEALDRIREFFKDHLVTEIPDIKIIVGTDSSDIPSYIFRTVVVVGSLGFGGAAYVICSYIFISLTSILNFIISLFLAACVALLSFFLQRRRYTNFVKALKAATSRKQR
ncbi:MAG TPA: hypothetical protein VFQ36_17870 [Ktedonobacteraceae bacterium]|nr:hypothetical protein [Ktedonobacteraceae bacterium]